MPASLISQSDSEITVQIKFPVGGPMLENEELIQKSLNEAGQIATACILGRFDTDGSPIQVGDIRFTSKGKFNQTYETPYGPIEVQRYVYQTSAGGRTYCPLEKDARLILNSTPRFAKMVSFKYVSFGANLVARDLLENHGRSIARGYVKDLSDMVGTISQAKEETWEYTLPEFSEDPKCISVGLDGTCIYLQNDGWRQAMVGTITFFDRQGERMHTIYMAGSPEYGKNKFLKMFKKEIEKVKEEYSDSIYIGLSDGAQDNWKFLEPYVDRQILDFYHVSEYVGEFACAVFGSGTKEKNENREKWLEDRLHNLKHKKDGAKELQNEMKELSKGVKGKENKEIIKKTLTYFENHNHQMWYSRQVRQKMPIGSGVTESACKVVVKQRLGQAGMRWKESGAALLLSIRPLVLTNGRWEEFWKLISKYGLPA
jgi:hypothetical protein